MKRAFYVGLAALTILVSASAAEAGCVFDLFSVANNTDVEIHYQVRWDNGQWQSFCVAPHSVRNHWFEITRCDHAAEIRFDRGGRTGDIHYGLDVYRGGDTCQGASYTFQYSGAYLDLTKDN